jgi:hypothetical protein
VAEEEKSNLLYKIKSLFDTSIKRKQSYITHHEITPQSNLPIQKLVISNFEWLTFYVNLLEIKSLQSILPYLFGTMNCPNCKEKISVFEGVMKAGERIS